MREQLFNETSALLPFPLSRCVAAGFIGCCWRPRRHSINYYYTIKQRNKIVGGGAYAASIRAFVAIVSGQL